MKLIELTWKGETYTLNENEAFEAADAVEDVATYGELVSMLGDLKSVRFVRVAKCYGVMLRHAGATVTDREIHDMFKAELTKDGGIGMLRIAIQSINTLTRILVGDMPAPVAAAAEDGDEKNEEAPAS